MPLRTWRPVRARGALLRGSSEAPAGPPAAAAPEEVAVAV